MGLSLVVSLQRMRFHMRIGVLAHEAEIAQSIEVDLSVWVPRDERARGAEGVVDYRMLYGIVADVVDTGHMKYLEDFVELVGEKALEIPSVTRVKVSVRKPHVALPGPLDYAEVSLDRTRDE